MNNNTKVAEVETTATLQSEVTPEPLLDVKDPTNFLNREISWIEFNRKVLEQASDSKVPLLERVKFLSIFYNNLDEFFMVRVANIWNLVKSNAEPTGADLMAPRRQMQEIRRKVLELLEKAEDLWKKKLEVALKKKSIEMTSYRDLSAKKKAILDRYFDEQIYPILTPQVIDSGHPFPLISNTSLNLIVELQRNNDPSKTCHYARLKCPHTVPRFLYLPKGDEEIDEGLGFDPNYREVSVVMMEDLITERVEKLFPGFTVTASGIFRVTRNTDGEIEEDEADDLLAAVRDYVDQRRFGNVVRLEMGRGMPVRLSEFLIRQLEVKPIQIYKEKIPLGFSEFMGLGCIDRPKLQYRPDRTNLAPELSGEVNCFEEIAKKDIVLYHPYDRFQGVLNFLDQAARDPNVVAIKQTLYRCGNHSPVVESLLEARRRGKQVTAVVELKARFDEERNINWAEELERAGVNVVYGFVGLKIHAKVCLVVRREKKGIRRYVHIGTGNYNASSAKIYTDLSLFTADEDINADVTDLFNVMTGCGHIDQYRKLFVSPHSMRPNLLKKIEEEIEFHRQQGNGHIVLKCNQLVDPQMIEALYKASQAGVRVECVIRGICCLRPGVKGLSENITVKSIVGRYLEHARIYWFNHGGDHKMYIGSADLMNRNLSGRIEVVSPIENPKIQAKLYKNIVKMQLEDTQQTWYMNADGSYTRYKAPASVKKVDAQNAENHHNPLY